MTPPSGDTDGAGVAVTPTPASHPGAVDYGGPEPHSRRNTSPAPVSR